MAKKTKANATDVASQVAAPLSTQAPDPLALQAALWAFIGKAASQCGARDDMADGQHSSVRFAITADVDGQRYQAAYAGTVDVGHASKRASSVGPDQDELFAVVLSKLNSATRDKICRDLAAEYVANGRKLPDVDAAIIEQAEVLRASMRQQVTQDVRGSVRCVVQPADAELLNVVRLDQPAPAQAG